MKKESFPKGGQKAEDPKKGQSEFEFTKNLSPSWPGGGEKAKVKKPELVEDLPVLHQTESPKKTKVKKAKVEKAKPAAEEGKVEKEPVLTLDQAREAYIKAKLKLEAEKSDQTTKEFEAAQKSYFGERQKDLQEKLEAVEKELTDKNLGDQEKSVELKKIASLQLVNEFKQSYDLKTRFLAEEKAAKEKPWILKKMYELSDEYRKASLKKKLLLAGVLIGGGITAGAVGGGSGLALATLIGGGHLVQRLLASGATFIGLEGLLKKSQQKVIEKETVEIYQKLINESFETAKSGTTKGWVEFLKARDLDLENKAGVAAEDIKKTEKRLANRRYLLAGTAGLLMASGLTATAFGNVANVVGLSAETLVAAPEAKAPIVAENALSQEVVETAAKEENFVATVEKSGGIWRAAHSLVAEGKITQEEFAHTWSTSTVDFNGVKVPIEDMSLSHAGDQVVYVAGEEGAPGHFEVVDYAKDKLSLGTNQDLYSAYEQVGKVPPDWLKDATSEDAIDALVQDHHLDVNEIRNVEFHFAHSSLGEQDTILGTLDYEIETRGEAAGDFIGLRDGLAESVQHTDAVAAYDSIIESAGFSEPEYTAIKDMKVGEFLEKRGRSAWSDYFIEKDVPHYKTWGISQIKHQRALAEFIRGQAPSGWERELTIDQFLKSVSNA